MIAVGTADDPMADVPSSTQETPARQMPVAPLRFGDSRSRQVIAEARRALAASDCVAIGRAADRLPIDHLDHDYVAYLAAWCEHLVGNDRLAFAELRRLIATADTVLATAISDEVITILARDGTTTKLAESMLADLHLWHVPLIDRYAEELFVAGRTEDAIAVVIANPEESPHATERACRALVEQCRVVRRRSARQIVSCSRTSPPASATCEQWRTQGLVRAVLDWPGEMNWNSRPFASTRVAELAAALGTEFPGYRDRLELVRLAATYDSKIRDLAVWRDLATRAERLARRASDGAVIAPARAIAEGARHNATALATRRCAQ
jgi:hypothetical protein